MIPILALVLVTCGLTSVVGQSVTSGPYKNPKDGGCTGITPTPLTGVGQSFCGGTDSETCSICTVKCEVEKEQYQGCWEADTSTYSGAPYYCADYTSHGYTCVGDYCTTDDPLGTPSGCTQPPIPTSENWYTCYNPADERTNMKDTPDGTQCECDTGYHYDTVLEYCVSCTKSFCAEYKGTNYIVDKKTGKCNSRCPEYENHDDGTKCELINGAGYCLLNCDTNKDCNPTGDASGAICTPIKHDAGVIGKHGSCMYRSRGSSGGGGGGSGGGSGGGGGSGTNGGGDDGDWTSVYYAGGGGSLLLLSIGAYYCCKSSSNSNSSQRKRPTTTSSYHVEPEIEQSLLSMQSQSTRNHRQEPSRDHFESSDNTVLVAEKMMAEMMKEKTNDSTNANVFKDSGAETKNNAQKKTVLPQRINLEEANPIKLWFQKHKIRTNTKVLQELTEFGVHEPMDLKHIDKEDISSICASLTKIDGKKFRAALESKEILESV